MIGCIKTVIRDGRVEVIFLFVSVLEMSCLSKGNRVLQCVTFGTNLCFLKLLSTPSRIRFVFEIIAYFIFRIYISQLVLKTTNKNAYIKKNEHMYEPAIEFDSLELALPQGSSLESFIMTFVSNS